MFGIIRKYFADRAEERRRRQHAEWDQRVRRALLAAGGLRISPGHLVNLFDEVGVQCLYVTASSPKVVVTVVDRRDRTSLEALSGLGIVPVIGDADQFARFGRSEAHLPGPLREVKVVLLKADEVA